MTYKIPANTKFYLSESLKNRITVNPNVEFLNSLKEEKEQHPFDVASDWMAGRGKYQTKKDLKQAQNLSGGYGGNKTKSSSPPDMGWNSVLFGDKSDMGMGSAAAAFALGNSLEVAGDYMSASGVKKGLELAQKALPKSGGGFFQNLLRSVGSAPFKAIPAAAGNILGQLGDISGANWFEQNVKQIGSNAQRLAAQGAGSPWVPLVAPTSKQKVSYATPTARLPYPYGVPGYGAGAYGLGGYGTYVP